MRIFLCQNCGQTLLFENTRCQRCGAQLGYLPHLGELTALDSEAEGYRAFAAPNEGLWRYCANFQNGVCNWLLPASEEATLCECCELNRHIPDLSVPDQADAWRRLEFAKHRLVYSLKRLQLPWESDLRFDFISSDAPLPPGAVASTGHAAGQVTITTEEADPAERELQRQNMEESYRTLIGHFRHEVGHYYWEKLVQPEPACLASFRQVFGDDRQDYAQALQRHYEQGPPPDWQQHFVSAYASSHPLEDWAECWAHYFHLIDTLETAQAFGLSMQPESAPEMAMRADIDPYCHTSLEDILARALPLTFAVNSLNRSMGQPDLYPFVLSPTVTGKLGFIHDVLVAQRR